jgi:Reverse transcriptase (RNA-dependent DNA polymerase)
VVAVAAGAGDIPAVRADALAGVAAGAAGQDGPAAHPPRMHGPERGGGDGGERAPMPGHGLGDAFAAGQPGPDELPGVPLEHLRAGRADGFAAGGADDAYRASPSRMVYIPKPDGRLQPLGIATLEDKIVQRAVVEVLNAVYEEDFLGFSYGFRPGRKPHAALDALAVGIEKRNVNWVLDADIRGFYDAIDHEWLRKFVEHRIADKRVLRLIQKWLNAGVVEDGLWSADHASLAERAVRRQDPRQEPSALAVLAGICAGGRPQGRSLPRMAGTRVTWPQWLSCASPWLTACWPGRPDWRWPGLVTAAACRWAAQGWAWLSTSRSEPLLSRPAAARGLRFRRILPCICAQAARFRGRGCAARDGERRRRLARQLLRRLCRVPARHAR